MLIALFSTIMASFADVSWKKSLSFWIKWRAHELWSYPIVWILFIYFLTQGFDIFSVWIFPIFIISIIALLDIIKNPVTQSVYREEKISVIMPYLNISKILIIIWSFFLFSDVSYTTLAITIFTIFIIAYASIDFKNKKLPRCFTKILFSEILRAIWAILWGWLVLSYSEIMYFNVYALIYLVPTVLLAWKSGWIKDYRKSTPTFWFYRLVGWLWWFSWFLSLIVIKNLGLSLSILLWFLGIWITLLVSYFLLKDRPSRKDIILTIVVSLLIWIWYYFK